MVNIPNNFYAQGYQDTVAGMVNAALCEADTADGQAYRDGCRAARRDRRDGLERRPDGPEILNVEHEPEKTGHLSDKPLELATPGAFADPEPGARKRKPKPADPAQTAPFLMSDDYHPKHGWTCFHCGETFTRFDEAKQHFGPTPDYTPGCIIKVNVGAERGLLACIRILEDRLAMHLREDSDTHRMFVDNQMRQSQALRTAEELGYERGLRDAKLAQ